MKKNDNRFNDTFVMSTPRPTRLNECALHDFAARRVQWILFPLSSPRLQTAARLQRMKDVREAIQKNLTSDCATTSRIA